MLLFAAACRCVTASSPGRVASAGRPVSAREACGRPAPTRAEVVACVAAVAAAGAAVTVVTAVLAHNELHSCCAGSGDTEFVPAAAGCRRQVLENVVVKLGSFAELKGAALQMSWSEVGRRG